MAASSRLQPGRRRPALVAAAALAGAALAGCGTAAAGKDASAAPPAVAHASAAAPATTLVCPHAGQVDRLTMTRINSFPRNHERFTFPARLTITTAQRARAAARLVCGLPPMPDGIRCPMDWGVSYLLRFTSGASRFQVVSADPTGCEQVDGVGRYRARWAARTPAFWRLLGTAAGITRPDLSAFVGTIPQSSLREPDR